MTNIYFTVEYSEAHGVYYLERQDGRPLVAARLTAKIMEDLKPHEPLIVADEIAFPNATCSVICFFTPEDAIDAADIIEYAFTENGLPVPGTHSDKRSVKDVFSRDVEG